MGLGLATDVLTSHKHEKQTASEDQHAGDLASAEKQKCRGGQP